MAFGMSFSNASDRVLPATGEPRHGLLNLDGVGPSCVGLTAGVWPTITDFLVERFPAIDRPTWVQRMQAGLVADEFGQPVTPQRPYKGHIRVYYYRALANEPRIPFEETVLFQDEHLVVADKPHFVPVTPSGHFLQETLLVRLKRRLGLPDLSPLHRIDRETAGLVLFSVRPQDRGAYQALFRRREVCKQYEAIAPWRSELRFPVVRITRIVEGEPFFRQCEVPGTPNSETHIELLGIKDLLGRYRLSPVTGKKHQLRVHMDALGLPILNDRVYPPRTPTPDDDYRFALQLLAQSIAFTDPVSAQPREFKTRLSLNWPSG